MYKTGGVKQKVNRFLRGNLFPEGFLCYTCDVEIFEGEMCFDCLKRFVINNGAACPKCGRKTAKSEICIECKANSPAYERALSPLVYTQNSMKLVLRFKSGRPYIARYLSKLIAAKIKELPPVDCIVFVPATGRALYKRGYNQSELLAAEVSRLTGIPLLRDAAEKIKEPPPQKGLSRAERLKNFKGVFKIDGRAVKGKTLLIVDDIMTTGATFESLAQSLKDCGAAKVYAVAAASVEY